MEYTTIKNIVQQLESCKYECIGGLLPQNVAFIALKKMGDRKYQTERYIGEKLYTEEGVMVYVKSLTGKYRSRAGGYITVTVCKNIYQNPNAIEYEKLLTETEQKEKEIAAALKILKKHGYKK